MHVHDAIKDTQGPDAAHNFLAEVFASSANAPAVRMFMMIPQDIAAFHPRWTLALKLGTTLFGLVSCSRDTAVGDEADLICKVGTYFIVLYYYNTVIPY